MTKKQKQQIKKKKQKKKKLLGPNNNIIEQLQNSQMDNQESAEKKEELENKSEMLSYPKKESQDILDSHRFNIYSRRNYDFENQIVKNQDNNPITKNDDLYAVESLRKPFVEWTPAKASADKNISDELQSQFYYEKLRLICKLTKIKNENSVNEKETEAIKNVQEQLLERVRNYSESKPIQKHRDCEQQELVWENITGLKRSVSLNFKLNQMKNDKIKFEANHLNLLPNFKSKSCKSFKEFHSKSKTMDGQKNQNEQKEKINNLIQDGDIKDIKVVYKRIETKPENGQSNVFKYTFKVSDEKKYMALFESLRNHDHESTRNRREDNSENIPKKSSYLSSTLRFIN